MKDWTLTHFADHSRYFGVAGFSALNAVGVRAGSVTGWLADPQRRVRYLLVTIRANLESTQHLIPVRSLLRINARRKSVQLVYLTRSALLDDALTIRRSVDELDLASLPSYEPPSGKVEELLARMTRTEVSKAV